MAIRFQFFSERLVLRIQESKGKKEKGWQGGKGTGNVVNVALPRICCLFAS